MRLIVLMGVLSGVAQAETCADYHQIHLRGILSSQTFPGPPNYTSVSSGDAEETYFFINLAQPVCVSKGQSPLEPAIDHIDNIQLIFDWRSARDSYEALRPYLQKSVECTGVLLGRHTGHHHSEVMLTDAKCHAT